MSGNSYDEMLQELLSKVLPSSWVIEPGPRLQKSELRQVVLYIARIEQELVDEKEKRFQLEKELADKKRIIAITVEETIRQAKESGNATK